MCLPSLTHFGWLSDVVVNVDIVSPYSSFSIIIIITIIITHSNYYIDTLNK